MLCRRTGSGAFFAYGSNTRSRIERLSQHRGSKVRYAPCPVFGNHNLGTVKLCPGGEQTVFEHHFMYHECRSFMPVEVSNIFVFFA